MTQLRQIGLTDRRIIDASALQRLDHLVRRVRDGTVGAETFTIRANLAAATASGVSSKASGRPADAEDVAAERLEERDEAPAVVVVGDETFYLSLPWVAFGRIEQVVDRVGKAQAGILEQVEPGGSADEGVDRPRNAIELTVLAGLRCPQPGRKSSTSQSAGVCSDRG